MTNFLFTCAGRRNYLLKYFKEALGGKGKIIAADMQMSAPAMAVADISIPVPGVYSAEYIDSLIEICKTENVRALLSLNDLELPLLSTAKDRFEKEGVALIVSSEKIIEICFDKWRTLEFALENNIACPETFLTMNDAIEAIESGKLNFPVTIKPRWGSASIGIEYPESIKELKLAYELINLKINRSILSEASNQDKNRAILIQEKISGTEYGLDILNDLEGNNVAVYVKEKLAMRAGETDKAVLRNRPDIKKLGETIGKALKHIGNLDCDIFEKDGELYLLEMNPRFGGGYPFSHMAGANYPAAIISWLEGKKADSSCFQYYYDKAFAKCDMLVEVPIKK